ncbi:MAG: hypothetical protein TYPL_5080 [Candidatus Tyloplasma litorale]|nr:MAG: hypothetical protein TYPL_5080 [Mycoplasmatales bacterium]
MSNLSVTIKSGGDYNEFNPSEDFKVYEDAEKTTEFPLTIIDQNQLDDELTIIYQIDDLSPNVTYNLYYSINDKDAVAFNDSITTLKLDNEVSSEPTIDTESTTTTSVQFTVKIKSGGDYNEFNPSEDFKVYEDAEKTTEFPLTIIDQNQLDDELTIIYQIDDLSPNVTYNLYYSINDKDAVAFNDSITTLKLDNEVSSEPTIDTESTTTTSVQFTVTIKSGGDYNEFNPSEDFKVYEDAEKTTEFPLTIIDQNQLDDELTIIYQIDDLSPNVTYNLYYSINDKDAVAFNDSITTLKLDNEVSSEPIVDEDSININSFQFNVVIKSGGDYQDFDIETGFKLYEDAEKTTEFSLEYIDSNQVEDDQLEITYQVNDLNSSTTYSDFWYTINDNPVIESDMRITTLPSSVSSLNVIEESIGDHSVQIQVFSDEENNINENNLALLLEENDAEELTSENASNLPFNPIEPPINDDEVLTLENPIGDINLTFESKEGNTAIYTISGLEGNTSYTITHASIDNYNEKWSEVNASFTTNDYLIPVINDVYVDNESITQTSFQFKIDITSDCEYDSFSTFNENEEVDNVFVKLIDENNNYQDSQINFISQEDNIYTYEIDNLHASTSYLLESVQIQGDHTDPSEIYSDINDSQFSTLKGDDPIDYKSFVVDNVGYDSFTFTLNLNTSELFDYYDSSVVQYKIKEQNSSDYIILDDSQIQVNNYNKWDSVVNITISNLADFTTYDSFMISYDDNEFIELFTEDLITNKYPSNISSIYVKEESIDEYNSEIILEINEDSYYPVVEDELIVYADAFVGDDLREENIKLNTTTENISDNTYSIKISDLIPGITYNNISISTDGTEKHLEEINELAFTTNLLPGAVSEQPKVDNIDNDSFDVTVNFLDDGYLGEYDDIIWDPLTGEKAVIAAINNSYVLSDGEILNSEVTSANKVDSIVKDNQTIDEYQVTLHVDELRHNTTYSNLSIHLGNSVYLDGYSYEWLNISEENDEISTTINKTVAYSLSIVIVIFLLLVILGIIIANKKNIEEEEEEEE